MQGYLGLINLGAWILVLVVHNFTYLRHGVAKVAALVSNIATAGEAHELYDVFLTHACAHLKGSDFTLHPAPCTLHPTPCTWLAARTCSLSSARSHLLALISSLSSACSHLLALICLLSLFKLILMLGPLACSPALAASHAWFHTTSRGCGRKGAR